MLFKKLFCKHEYEGCKCKICGKIQDEVHRFIHCKCAVCGRLRDEDHDYELVESKPWDIGDPTPGSGNHVDGFLNRYKCTVCGKEYEEETV